MAGTWLRQHVFSLKTISLIGLSVQTSTMVLLLRYSRTSSLPSSSPSLHHNYLITTAVLLSEVIKLLLSLSFLHIQAGCVLRVTIHHLASEIFCRLWETVKLGVPAFLYVVQNNLLFIALSNLDAGTYQVTYQLKILTTAIFSWVILGKKLTPIHWLSLCLLMLGVSLVQVEGAGDELESGKPLPEEIPDVGKIGENEDSLPNNTHNLAHPNTEVSRLLGILAVFVSCVSSGFSGVYFERLVKRGTQTSLLIRNIQLGIFSITFAIIAVTTDTHAIKQHGFFQGYTFITWLVILVQACGGLMVSVTMKYADNILKGFATSISIVMSTAVSYLALGDAAPTPQYLLGAGIVIASTVLYGATPSASYGVGKIAAADSSVNKRYQVKEEQKLD